MLVSIGAAFLGFEHTSFPVRPPEPRAIPYAQWRPDWLDLAPADLPEYDASLSEPEVSYSLETSTDGPEYSRLLARQPCYVGGVGWPWTTVSWTAMTAWDVSDPDSHFEQATGSFQSGVWFPNGSIGCTWPNADGTVLQGLEVHTPGVVVQLALPQLVSGIIVISAVCGYRWRRRHRRRRGRCTACGHRLDPRSPLVRCPECGSEPVTGEDSSRRRGPGRIIAAAFVVITVAWLLPQLAAELELRTEPEPYVRAYAETATSLGRTFTKHVTTYEADYGRPSTLLMVQDAEWFAFSPSRPPQPAARLWPRFRIRPDGISYAADRGNPSRTRLYQLNWGMLMLQLAVIQIGCTLAGFLVWRVWRRVRGATVAPATP